MRQFSHFFGVKRDKARMHRDNQPLHHAQIIDASFA
jgi:hypothetical protein